MSYKKEKKEIIYWAKFLNKRGLVTARSGNVSYRVTEDKILITTHDSYLGHLEKEDIVLSDLVGNILTGKGELTSEKNLHLAVYKKFENIKVTLHSHSPYTTAFFHYFDELEIFSFEARFYLGKIKVVSQELPTIINLEPVIKNLEASNVVVLKDHGVVAVGENFKAAFSLIELLEEQARVNFLIKSVKLPERQITRAEEKQDIDLPKYRLLSKEHISKLVGLINDDSQAQELGKKYDMTCSLAVKNQDSGEAVCFYYEKGKITKTDNNQNTEFLIVGKEDILRKIFNREIDPFVASTQGKVKTKGDFAKLSRWYPVLVRTFKLWEKAPVK